jgi:hypothetical protein
MTRPLGGLAWRRESGPSAEQEAFGRGPRRRSRVILDLNFRLLVAAGLTFQLVGLVEHYDLPVRLLR